MEDKKNIVCYDFIARGCRLEEIDNNICSACNQQNCSKLEVQNWLADIPESANSIDVIEVRFKNTRKAYFQNVNKLRLEIGDIIAVEASPGHDIGIVSLTGDLVMQQMKKSNIPPDSELKKVYRKAKSTDIEKWKAAIYREYPTMIKARKIAEELKLDMKIGDVEFQGDNTKAIFYYIADERVDFRELIKKLAEEFKVRVEMRQIGARQEAGRIGGIGSCGRELCCSTWITNFVSVTTNSARYQELSLNPQKLAGQCGKLKCCLNYELDCYLDAQKDFPKTSIPLNTKEGLAYHQKTDIFKRIMWYSFNSETSMSLIPVTVERVAEIQKLNKKNIVPDKLTENLSLNLDKSGNEILDYENTAGKESLDRFNNKKNRKKTKKRKRPKRRKNHDKK